MTEDTLAEWSKALASGASPQGRGFEPHRCHDNVLDILRLGLALNENDPSATPGLPNGQWEP